MDSIPAERLPALIRQLQADKYTHAAFISPSGNGIKVIVRTECQTIDEHLAYYAQLTAYYAQGYNLTTKDTTPKGEKPNLDPQCKNPNRLCFLPYDPQAYYNPESAVMPLLDGFCPIPEPAQAGADRQDERFASLEVINETTRRLLNDSIGRLQQESIDLTESYDQWVEMGFSFASMGDEGRPYFHQVSRLNAKYKYLQCEAKFTELLKARSGNVTIGTFLRRCEEAMGKTWEQSGKLNNPGQANSSTSQWVTPKPLVSPLLPVLPVRPSMIPALLQPWLTDIAFRMKCPLDFVASSAVVMLSSLIGTRLAIMPKSRDTWLVVPNLWGAVIGDPSAMKTPSVAEVLKPLNRVTLAARSTYKTELQDYEQAQFDYETQKKVYQQQQQDILKGKAVANPVEFPTAPAKPTERRYITNDSTIEKLADILNENPSGLLVHRDEVIGLLAGWEKAGHEQDRAFYLEGWNGSGSITIDRMGRGTTYVKNVCISLFGGIQPPKLIGYLQAATGYENDGFVQRLQLAVYPDKAAWAYTDDHPDTMAKTQAFELIRAIADSDFSAIAYEANEYDRYPFTRFNDQAQAIFKDWLIQLETQVLPNESGLLLEHFTKYRSLMPSLALIFHVVNCVNLPTPTEASHKYLVSVEATQMAIEWCTYLQSHARRIYGLLDTLSIGAAKELLRHLKRGVLPDGFKARQVTKKGWANLTTLEQIESALAELVAHNWLKEVKPVPPVNGRPEAPHYLIHPKLSQNT